MNALAYYEILFPAFLLLLWLTCVYEAFSSLSGGRVRKIEERNSKLAQKLENWMEQDDVIRAVTKILMFITAAVVGMTVYVALRHSFGHLDINRTWWWVAIFLVISLANILCELIARWILVRFDIAILRFSIPIVVLLARTIFLPFVWILEKVSEAADDLQKTEGEAGDVKVEDEILSYVESYNDDADSDLEEGEKQMIRGILEIGDMSVHEIMTPRVDLTAISGTATVEEAKKMFVETGHSRIPVYGRNVDEIRGILYAKDFLNEEALKNKNLFELSHPPIFIPETKVVSDLLDEIKSSRNHFAVIIDEYGGTSGVVTFEDIIEEIVGEVHDEYDTESDFEKRPQLMPDGTIILEGRTSVSDVNDIADVKIPDIEDADTIGGYICFELGKIPEINTEFIIPGQVKMTVLEADTRCIKKLKLEILEDDNSEEEKD